MKASFASTSSAMCAPMSASRTAIVLIGSLVCALLSGAVIGAIGAYAYLIVISPAMAAITAAPSDAPGWPRTGSIS